MLLTLRVRLSAVLVLAVVCSACSGDGGAASTGVTPASTTASVNSVGSTSNTDSSLSSMAPRTVNFSTLAQGGNSGIVTARNVVVRDAPTWDALWAEHGSLYIPPPTPLAVDFKTTMVLAVFLGSRPNGCYGLEIKKVEQLADKLLVSYRESVPAEGVLCAAALVAPAHIITVPVSALPVAFVQLP